MIEKPMKPMTLKELEQALPSSHRTQATPRLLAKINKISEDPEEARIIRENILGYMSIIQNRTYRVGDYVNAVKFCTFRLMGMSIIEAYKKALPERVQRIEKTHAASVLRGISSSFEEYLQAYATAFSKSKVISAIMEQSYIPTWILNQDLHQKAINVQARLMVEAKSDLVKMQAANSLLTHLAKPANLVPTVNIDMRETSGLKELKDMLTSLATKQKELISQGVSTKTIAEQSIVEGEVTDVDG